MCPAFCHHRITGNPPVSHNCHGVCSSSSQVDCTMNCTFALRWVFKKISSLKIREDICIIYSTFLYYLTFKLRNRTSELLSASPQFNNMTQISPMESELAKFDVQMAFLDEYSEKRPRFDAKSSFLIIFKRYFL